MFLAVADAGGFNQAAEQIHKSQSTIHHGVQKLEESLGLSLFATEGRKVVLTAAGELMRRRARYLLDEAAKVEALGMHLAGGVETELSIAVDHAYPHDRVYSAITRVIAEYPQLCINLRETVLSGSNERLLQGDVDLAISPLTLPDCLNEELSSVEFVAVANPAHELHAAGTSLTQEDLKAHRQIVTRDSAQRLNVDQGWLGAEQRWTVEHPADVG